LNLKNNHIGSAGVKNLKLPINLKSLNLDGNNILAEGAQSLQLPSKSAITKFTVRGIASATKVQNVSICR